MGASNGDLCWSASNEYFLTFNGRSDQIFRHGNTNEWRLRDDPAWRIMSFTGAPNGDNDGEYFVVIEPNGTKHWFGSGTEAGGLNPRYTNSTFTVPVTGGVNEPCNSAVGATSFCQQAWRWNVDRSQDTNDNVISYFYENMFPKPPGARHRDSFRIVTGSDGSAYFTSHHYNSFILFYRPV